VGRTTNGSCQSLCWDGPWCPCAGPGCLMGGGDGPSTTRWLVTCQARPMAHWAMSCLGRARFHMPRASSFGPARKYMNGRTPACDPIAVFTLGRIPVLAVVSHRIPTLVFLCSHRCLKPYGLWCSPPLTLSEAHVLQ
jgi:hypothetical protein